MTSTAPASAPAPERRPLSRNQRGVVRSVGQSVQIPQFSVDYDIDTAGASALIAELRAQGVTVSQSDVLTAACARTLRSHPLLRSQFDDDALLEHSGIHVAFVVGLEDGLVGPTILDADARPLPELAAERMRLVRAARENKLKPHEVFSAVFTISNLGGFGVPSFRALVVPPQAAILAVGTITDGIMRVTLSCDHRVVNGLPAAEFLRDLAALYRDEEWLASLK